MSHSRPGGLVADRRREADRPRPGRRLDADLGAAPRVRVRARRARRGRRAGRRPRSARTPPRPRPQPAQRMARPDGRPGSAIDARGCGSPGTGAASRRRRSGGGARAPAESGAPRPTGAATARARPAGRRPVAAPRRSARRGRSTSIRSVAGGTGNTAVGVPAAAHTTWNRPRSGSMTTRTGRAWPIGGMPPIVNPVSSRASFAFARRTSGSPVTAASRARSTRLGPETRQRIGSSAPSARRRDEHERLDDLAELRADGGRGLLGRVGRLA